MSVSTKSVYDVIIAPVVSEKSYGQLDEGKYTFEVATDSNKLEIKQAIEKAGENATREDVRNAVAGMTFDGVTGKFTMDKSGSPTKSVTVLEMKDGKPVYNTTVQPK